MYYLNTFFVYSVIGYLLETFISFITHSNFKSGILYGAWTPIYGLGAITIILLSNYLFLNLHFNRFVETLIVFFIVTILLTILEYLGGVGIEKVFHITFWDYSNHKFHLGRYVSLTMSVIWGILSIFLIYVIKPLIDKFIVKIPFYISIIMCVLFVVDVFSTIYLKAKK